MARVRKDETKARRNSNAGQPQPTEDSGPKLGGFLGALGGLLEKLSDLAETGEHFARSGEIRGLDPNGKLRGVYGISLKTGLGEHGQQELKVEPFGNLYRQPSGEPAVNDVREPLVDVYEEEDHVLVLAEIPGVSKKDVQLDFDGDRLTISAQRGDKSYRKDVTLPGQFSRDKTQWDCANGILKIRLER